MTEIEEGTLAAVEISPGIWEIARAVYPDQQRMGRPDGLYWFSPDGSYLMPVGGETRAVPLMSPQGQPVAQFAEPVEPPETPTLDRRDEFAKSAMQGLLAGGFQPKHDESQEAAALRLARRAVAIGDELILALEEGT